MQNTSQTWKNLWAGGTARLEARAIIAGVVYTDMPTAPVINRALMQNGLSIGNAASATCQLSVRTTATIPKSAEVVIQYRLTDGTTASEWLTAGTFYISHRQRDPVTGVLALVCYDGLLKANATMPKLMPWTTNGGQVMTTKGGEWLYLSVHYPRTMAAVLNDILLITGFELAPDTQIAEGDGYVIDDVNPGTTINNVLGQIAAANGGNWIMTPAGKLKLVPVVSASGAAGATANVVDVDGIVGGIGVSNTGTITGIRYGTEDGSQIVGNETGLVIDANVTQDVAATLLSRMRGMTYQAYELRGAVYDPAAELGDYVRAGANGEVRAVLCAEVATLGPGFRGDISAPEIGEMADEYPYVKTNDDTLTAAQEYAEAAAARAVAALDRTLTQEELFYRLTDGGAEQGIALESMTNPGPSASTPKRVVLNLDYARYGVLSANQINLSDYATPISAPDENDPSTLLRGQSIDEDGWIVQTGGDVTVCYIDDAIPYRGETLVISGTTKKSYPAQGYRILITVYVEGDDGQWIEAKDWEEQMPGFPAAYGQIDADGNLIGPTTTGEDYRFTDTLTIPDNAEKVEVYWDCNGVKSLSVGFDVSQNLELKYTSNIGIGYKGLQVGKFVVDRTGNATMNGSNKFTGPADFAGGVSANGTPGASGSYTTADGKTVTVTNGIITAIT